MDIISFLSTKPLFPLTQARRFRDKEISLVLKEKKKIRIPGNQPLNQKEKEIPHVPDSTVAHPFCLLLFGFSCLLRPRQNWGRFHNQASLYLSKTDFFFKFSKIFVVVAFFFFFKIL